jgi:hypothetical protein
MSLRQNYEVNYIFIYFWLRLSLQANKKNWWSETNLLNSFRTAGGRCRSVDFSREPLIMKLKQWSLYAHRDVGLFRRDKREMGEIVPWNVT